MPFVKGQSGNPAGRPIGARNKVNRDLPRNLITLDAEEALADGAGDLAHEIMAQAKAANPAAMRLCMDRMSPMGRNRPMTITLPSVDTPDYIGAAVTVVLDELSEGELTVAEANGLIAFIDRTARLLTYRAEMAARAELDAQIKMKFAEVKAEFGIVNNRADTMAPETMAPGTPAQPSTGAPAEKINKNMKTPADAPAAAGTPALANNNAVAGAPAGKTNSTLYRLMSSTSALTHAAAMGAPKLPATPPASRAA